jgi:uncharacterized RDD family membrane protein YckC
LEVEIELNIISFLLGIAIMILYYLVTEGMWQRSLAKMLTKTRVVDADGGTPSIGQIIGRTLARFIPFEQFSFFGNKGYPIGWHDSLSGTRVIQDPRR